MGFVGSLLRSYIEAPKLLQGAQSLLYWGHMRLYRDDGKENRNYCSIIGYILGLYEVI